jgi:hypothetical protein
MPQEVCVPGSRLLCLIMTAMTGCRAAVRQVVRETPARGEGVEIDFLKTGRLIHLIAGKLKNLNIPNLVLHWSSFKFKKVGKELYSMETLRMR